MIKIDNLTKQYNEVLAVNNMSFEVEDGEIAVLLGPNGAGKSTSIKCICGLLRYDGDIEIQGHKNKTLEAKKVFSYVPETPALYDMLTIYEHLEYIANAYKIDNYKEKAEALLKRFDLYDKKDKLGKELSKGMQQKASICCGLLTEPKVILFDEPMIGLDPKAIKELKKVFLELKENGCSVIISTHIIDSIDDIWDKAIVINKGSIVYKTTRSELKEKNESLEEIFFEVTEE
ncbi:MULTISPECIES: ABC transporter ATP-binding protein [Clostridium]|uniref:ABC transporter, ATP-binding protein n=1 Tax=Clostridium novyi (strain NT) TaxID=386415 RepID=A0PY22_CLONN|nr:MULTISPECIES: ABC transporter ATP-binding protein [Clostridium]ABK60968.1 ABC transporter, ATP-binding protein [Clostridium novyi NT]KEH87268.1 ABC transporter ATP-binding protein [Clostridium novyi A str. NCTC 538]KEH90146.1 ABC transporter ATP-binding protein [Clostridium novyi A str. 4540]KEH90783.1 ABC transporter ATP-binding protein [Clostridium novyi A str. BKT29909]KEH92168.1 ABC transporter ATP-binding protein [Clostridium botulinum C/D str. It1]